MAQGRLNRDGRDSYRNLDRPFRAPREILDKNGDFVKFHDMDVMRLGNHDRSMNTTGSFGVKSTMGVGRLSIVVRKGAPGKSRAGRKKKNGSKLISRRFTIDYDKHSFPQLRNLRNDLIVVKTMSEGLPEHQGRKLFTFEMQDVLRTLDNYIETTFDAALIEQIHISDQHRIASTKGMMRSGKVRAKGIEDLGNRIYRALSIMNIKHGKMNT
jgi:hypothetical protein